MSPADMKAIRKQLTETLHHEPSENELASYNMYPKVFNDFAATQNLYGPTSVLPTPVYFYGLKVGDEIFVEIEKGKIVDIKIEYPDDYVKQMRRYSKDYSFL